MKAKTTKTLLLLTVLSAATAAGIIIAGVWYLKRTITEPVIPALNPGALMLHHTAMHRT